MLKGQIVEVTWLDAMDHKDTWVDVKDVEAFGDEEKLVCSVGYFIRKTDKYLTIAGDMDDVDGDCGRVCKIPIGFVKGIVTLVGVSS